MTPAVQSSWIVNRARVSRLELAVLLGILILAAVLRLGAPGVVEFKRDEANLSHLALDFVRGRSLPLLGISSSVGIPNSPISVYIFAIPYLFSSDPTVATLYVGLLNVLAVLLTYLLARRYYGVGAALLAALLYAVSPWGIIYSRKIWAQDVLPPFIVATFLTGLLGFVEGKRWAQWLCLPLLCITAQIHYSALLLAIPAAYLILIGRSRWTRAFALSFIPAILLAIPFLIGVLRADLPSLDELRALTTANTSAPDESPSLTLTGQMVHYAALTIAGTEIHSLAGPQAFQKYLDSVPDAYPLFGLLAWGVLFSAFWLLFRSWKIRDSRRLIDGLLLIWLITPIAAFSITWTELYPHYLILMMPAVYIVLGTGASDLWCALASHIALRRGIFALVGTTLLALVSLQVFLWLSLVNFLDENNTPDGFGTPLHDLITVRNSVLAAHPTQVVARFEGQTAGDEAAVWSVLLDDVATVRFVDVNTDVYPAQPTTLLAHDCDPADNSKVFMLRSLDEGCYRVTDEGLQSLEGASFKTVKSNLSFANGVRLIGYQWVVRDQPCFNLAWSISAPAAGDYSFSVHFFNADGQETVNADGLSWRGVYWRPGDTVVRHFCLIGDQAARQSEIAGVNIGMYTYDGTNFHNLDLLDSNGTPAGQTISIPFEQ
ncbi:MAG: glycosyltransferase family 39 protein [Chloroflexota bacterium]